MRFELRVSVEWPHFLEKNVRCHDSQREVIWLKGKACQQPNCMTHMGCSNNGRFSAAKLRTIHSSKSVLRPNPDIAIKSLDVPGTSSLLAYIYINRSSQAEIPPIPSNNGQFDGTKKENKECNMKSRLFRLEHTQVTCHVGVTSCGQCHRNTLSS